MPGGEKINFEFLLEQSVDVICCTGFDRLVRYISPSCLQLLGWKPEELVGKGPEAYILGEDLPLLDTAGVRIQASETRSDATTVRMCRKDGSIVWVEINVRLVLDPVTGEPREHVIVMRDVSERKKLEVQLTVLALTDGLTCLSNRRAFDEALEREWMRTLREGSQISLLLLDIDHFKAFNDLHGHRAGDQCLRAVAAAFSGAVRAMDVVARYGGDEMAAILPMIDIAGAVRVAQRARAAIEFLRLPNLGNPEGGGWVTVSVGVATASPADDRCTSVAGDLFQAADRALYRAKSEGRNHVATALLGSSEIS
jgi:diguanylate cyclase (GGDEF)-like protein/PAS domain S-box-containing protein